MRIMRHYKKESLALIMGIMGAIKKGIIPLIPHYKKGFSRE